MRPKRSTHRLPGLAAAAVFLAGLVPAAARPVVVELFTSQSCSSCPPAEALIGDLAREGGDVLPLAYHVTYWNHLDWRDTFSLPAATERQHAYAERLGDSVYTPQAVIDGRTSLVGSQESAVRAAIASARGGGDGVSVSLVREGGLSVRLGAGQGSGRITLVGFDPSHVTPVARGENAGRTLVQANVVRSVAGIGRWTGTPQTLTVPWPAGEAAAVIVQDEAGHVVGAARTGG
ncbi:DUF1223 domain-containing protein [Methylobacterium sp. J-076]|uniref:DUF1223 domain-containing protein n=1 Tax=Methylobacterium sp. J-076 TaxID=2836655 RepID=UPI001FBA8931|nr:DUF1223 domain-containing protein [Methylobacterium sp. J-076]MCJ2014515.1 DUF1223 domain-containing protein [Methylobacterium sp. J-076]